MTHRRLSREMDCAELAEQMAFDMVEHEMAIEAQRRATLEADALAGLKARKDGKRRR